MVRRNMKKIIYCTVCAMLLACAHDANGMRLRARDRTNNSKKISPSQQAVTVPLLTRERVKRKNSTRVYTSQDLFNAQSVIFNAFSNGKLDLTKQSDAVVYLVCSTIMKSIPLLVCMREVCIPAVTSPYSASCVFKVLRSRFCLVSSMKIGAEIIDGSGTYAVSTNAMDVKTKQFYWLREAHRLNEACRMRKSLRQTGDLEQRITAAAWIRNACDPLFRWTRSQRIKAITTDMRGPIITEQFAEELKSSSTLDKLYGELCEKLKEVAKGVGIKADLLESPAGLSINEEPEVARNTAAFVDDYFDSYEEEAIGILSSLPSRGGYEPATESNLPQKRQRLESHSEESATAFPLSPVVHPAKSYTAPPSPIGTLYPFDDESESSVNVTSESKTPENTEQFDSDISE